MSGASVGAVEMQMLMDMARWTADVTNAGRVLDGGLDKMKSSVKTAMGALGIGLSVGAFTKMIQGSIDATEALHDMAIQTGATVENLSAMQAIGKTTGTSAEAISAAMNKLAKNMAVSNEESKGTGQAIKALGLNFDQFRAMKPDQQMVALAQAMNKFEDGSGKSAVAMTLLGKEGAKMLPFMKDLAGAGELVATVTTEQAAAADEFNDSMARSGLAVEEQKRALAMRLLPAMSSLLDLTVELAKQTGNYLTASARGAASEFDAMGLTIRVLGTVMEALVVMGADVVFVFKGIGSTLGGLAAQVAAVATGNFEAVAAIQEEMKANDAAARDELEKFQASVVGTTDRILQARDAMNKHSVSAAENAREMASLVGRHGEAKKTVLDFSAANEEAAKAQAKLTKAGQDYLTQLNAEYGAVMQSISLGRDLTDGEKALLKLEEQLAAGKMVLTAAEKLSAEAKLREIDATKEQRKQAEDYAKLLVAVAQHSSKWNDEQTKTTDSLRAGNVALLEENAKLGMTSQAWDARQIAVLNNQAADLEWQAANQGGNFQLEEQARLLRERAQLLADGTVLKEAQATADEWKKVTESINAGLTDALMRAFESGKGFLDAFKDTLLNAFRTLILKPMVQSMVAQLAGGMKDAMAWIGSAVGMAGASGGAGGTGQTAGAATAAGGAAAGGSWLPYVGWAMMAVNQASNDYDAGWNRNGAGSFGRGLNTAVNPFADMFRKFGSFGLLNNKWTDVLSGDTAMARMFGYKDPRVTAQGISGSFGGGAFSGQQFQDWKADGGWFRGDKSGTQTAALDTALGSNLNSVSSAMLGHVQEYASALALPVTALAGVTQSARIILGSDAAANQKAIDDALAGYGAALVAGYQQALAAAAQPGESTIDTLNRLGQSILAVNTTFEALGLNLVQTSVAGGQAADNIISLTGGLDAFLAKTQSYLGNYFSEAEQMGITAGGVLNTLSAAGLDFKGATSRGDLRALMETMNPNNAMDQGHIAALLNVSSDFAKVADYLQTSGLTLAQLAGQAPAGYDAFVGPRIPGDPAGTSQALQVAANDSLVTIVTNTNDSVVSLRALVDAFTAGNQGLIDRVEALGRAVEASARRFSDSLIEAAQP